MEIVGTCQSIISIGFQIKDMVATFSTNKEDCGRILRLVDIVQAVVDPLRHMQPIVVENMGMGEALKGLEEALERSLKVIKTCRKKSAILRFIVAKDIARDLHRVYGEISIHLTMVNLANTIDIRSTLTEPRKKQADLRTSSEAPPNAHPQQQKQADLRTRSSDAPPITYPRQQKKQADLRTSSNDAAPNAHRPQQKQADLRTRSSDAPPSAHPPQQKQAELSSDAPPNARLRQQDREAPLNAELVRNRLQPARKLPPLWSRRWPKQQSDKEDKDDQDGAGAGMNAASSADGTSPETSPRIRRIRGMDEHHAEAKAKLQRAKTRHPNYFLQHPEEYSRLLKQE